MLHSLLQYYKGYWYFKKGGGLIIRYFQAHKFNWLIHWSKF